MVTPLPSLKYISFDGDIQERFDDIVGVTLYEGEPVNHIMFWADDTDSTT